MHSIQLCSFSPRNVDMWDCLIDFNRAQTYTIHRNTEVVKQSFIIWFDFACVDIFPHLKNSTEL